MAEDYKNAFDYYNAEPPKEGASLPPEDACMPAPEDEYNENVHGTDYVKRTSGSARSAALAHGSQLEYGRTDAPCPISH